LPAKSNLSNASSALGGGTHSETNSRNSSDSQTGRHLPVPVPIYCRPFEPFMEQSPGMRVSLIQISFAGRNGYNLYTFIIHIYLQIFCASGINLSCYPNASVKELSYLSHVWVCTATHSASRVSIIDANRPADVLLSFEVCSSHLLCISSVPGNYTIILKLLKSVSNAENRIGY
jgi:hypothetical protein